VAVTGGVACVGVAGILPMGWLEGCGQLKPVAGKGCDLVFYRVVSSSLKQEEPVWGVQWESVALV
jgi:hypothetical protein